VLHGAVDYADLCAWLLSSALATATLSGLVGEVWWKTSEGLVSADVSLVSHVISTYHCASSAETVSLLGHVNLNLSPPGGNYFNNNLLQLLFLFNSCMFASKILLAALSCLQLLKPRLPLQRGINRRTRGRRLGRSVWGQPHLALQFYRADRLWLSCCR
jgi:hypothetical protein